MNAHWIDVANMKNGIKEAKTSELRLNFASQSVYGLIGKMCEVFEIGPNPFNVNLVIIGLKDFTYASLLNY